MVNVTICLLSRLHTLICCRFLSQAGKQKQGADEVEISSSEDEVRKAWKLTGETRLWHMVVYSLCACYPYQGCAYTPYLHFQTVYTVRLRYGTVQNRIPVTQSKWKYGTVPVRYGKPVDGTSLHGHPFWGACPPGTQNFRPNNYHYIILIIKEWNKYE